MATLANTPTVSNSHHPPTFANTLEVPQPPPTSPCQHTGSPTTTTQVNNVTIMISLGWQAWLNQVLNISLKDNSYKILKVREGASALEINLSIKPLLLQLHPDKNKFEDWLMDHHQGGTFVLEQTLMEAKVILGKFWNKFLETKDNLVQQDMGLFMKAGIIYTYKHTYIHTYIHTCIYIYRFTNRPKDKQVDN